MVKVEKVEIIFEFFLFPCTTLGLSQNFTREPKGAEMVKVEKVEIIFEFFLCHAQLFDLAKISLGAKRGRNGQSGESGDNF